MFLHYFFCVGEMIIARKLKVDQAIKKHNNLEDLALKNFVNQHSACISLGLFETVMFFCKPIYTK